ncbi:hypothetical protein ACIBI3_20360 [Actinomadura luteofluorescens]|uniref:hypothetical protein n=1 Tax=Actinomadura luteofluorescens TaxID=46163 RepID=UPI003488794F
MTPFPAVPEAADIRIPVHPSLVVEDRAGDRYFLVASVFKLDLSLWVYELHRDDKGVVHMSSLAGWRIAGEAGEPANGDSP